MTNETHYKLHTLSWLEPMTAPKGGMQTAAIRSCCECHRILSSMGGGGTYLCEDCRQTKLYPYYSIGKPPTIARRDQYIEELEEALSKVADQSYALRVNGPAPEDLQGLHDALEDAVETAVEMIGRE